MASRSAIGAISREEFERANRRGNERMSAAPRVLEARYSPRARRVVLRLDSNLIVSFSPHDVQGLESARASQLSAIEISPSGLGIHFPALDADVYVPGLLEGALGSRSWTANKAADHAPTPRRKAS